MAFRLVQSGGDVTDPAVVNMYASGTVWPGSVVDFRTASGYVSAASSSSTRTSIIGVCMDYAQGKSDTLVRVVPFVPGQVWEADCTSNTSTGMVLIQHALTDAKTLANTSYDQTMATGVFLAFNTRGAAADKKMLGEFLAVPQIWYPSQTTYSG